MMKSDNPTAWRRDSYGDFLYSVSSMNTFFAPAEREPAERVLTQQQHVSDSLDFGLLGNAITDLIVVLNDKRQIVYANPAMTAFMKDHNQSCGMRPGEALDCVHAWEQDGGCGTSASCGFCGAGTAIVDALNGVSRVSRECIISVRDTSSTDDLSFDVSVSPFVVDTSTYVLVYFKDSQDRRRRSALERIFFHDILNTASSLKVYIDLMKREDGHSAYVSALESISQALVEEIESHKILAYAESGALNLQENLISTQSLTDTVIETYRADPLSNGVSLVIGPFSEAFGFVSDEVLFRRILMNMVKNALEASEAGGEVQISYQRADGMVVFSVTNIGTIPPEVRGRIFTRYFSTKGENRGLGTYGMRLLAERYLDGRVAFDPGDDGIVKFSVSIPFRGVEALR